ncbi:MAG: MFS transporter [Pseudomonas sp.]|jgi:predicted MFS family arabinose efflux permease|uniref:MFS transporter n=1 Tax=Pseudomonas sp. TaxID=306 RepID=UPI002399209C|nr:MFS transporter [Pseudomonas sp.]MDE1195676.1 MFS transporter [Pseudomonas sp.]
MTSSASPSSRDFFIAAAALLIAMVGTTLPTPLYAIYQQRLGFDASWLTIIFSIYAAGVIAALLAVGSWSDQLGRRPMLLAGLLMGAISAVIFLCTDSIGGLLIGRLFSGFSAGIMTGTATVAVIELAPKTFKNATLMATAANMLGLGLGPLLAGFTSQHLADPLHLVFYVHLALLLLAALGVAVIRETVQRPPQLKLGIQKPSVPASVRSVFISASIAGLAGFSVAGLFTSMVPSVMIHIMDVHGGLLIGAVIGLFFVASILGQASLQWLPKSLHMSLGCVGLIIGMICLGLSIATAQLLLLVLAGLLAGIGQGMILRAGMGAVTASSPPHQKAAVTSAFFVVLYVSISVPVVAVGFSVQVFGLPHVGEFFASLVAVVALLAMISMRWVQSRQAVASPSGS